MWFTSVTAAIRGSGSWRRLSEGQQGIQVLGKAGTSETDPRLQEGVPDPGVHPHPPGHRPDIGPDLLTEAGDLVDEGDLGGQKGVGGILDHLGAAPVHQQHRPSQRGVDLHQQVGGFLLFGADDDAVGVGGIIDGRPLAQEFRIGDHLPGAGGGTILKEIMQGVSGADRHRALDHRAGGARCWNGAATGRGRPGLSKRRSYPVHRLAGRECPPR